MNLLRPAPKVVLDQMFLQDSHPLRRLIRLAQAKTIGASRAIWTARDTPARLEVQAPVISEEVGGRLLPLTGETGGGHPDTNEFPLSWLLVPAV